MAIKKRTVAKAGIERDFWRLVDQTGGDDAPWWWLGATNNNHNTVDCASYDYGVFKLEDRYEYPQKKIHSSEFAHRIILFLTYGRELSRQYEVFPLFGDYLDINPRHLGVRDVKTRREVPAPVFFDVANDNDGNMAVAA